MSVELPPGPEGLLPGLFVELPPDPEGLLPGLFVELLPGPEGLFPGLFVELPSDLSVKSSPGPPEVLPSGPFVEFCVPLLGLLPGLLELPPGPLFPPPFCKILIFCFFIISVDNLEAVKKPQIKILISKINIIFIFYNHKLLKKFKLIIFILFLVYTINF